MRSREFAAIPLVVVLLGGVGLSVLAISVGAWAWYLPFAFTVVAAAALLWWYGRRRPHPPGDDAPKVARPDGGVFRVLLVADEACSAGALQAEIASKAAGRRTRAFVVAPALSSRLDRLTGDEDAYRAAQERLQTALDQLHGSGIQAEGRTGPHDPIQAADDGLREFQADLVVLAARPPNDANRLERDLLAVARDRYDVPVTQLRTEPSRGGTMSHGEHGNPPR